MGRLGSLIQQQPLQLVGSVCLGWDGGVFDFSQDFARGLIGDHDPKRFRLAVKGKRKRGDAGTRWRFDAIHRFG